MFVLGIDPGLTTTGYGIVQTGHPPVAVAAGVVRTDSADPLGNRLSMLYRGLREVIAEYSPAQMAIEMVFTNRNLQTAISVGRASGVAILAGAEAGMDIAEYAPTAIKAAVTGDGAADKAGVAAMVARLLDLHEPPRPADAADALAVAICHIRSAALVGGKR
ncbi:MAG: crossover junction endodeoxyribonuclease RuvC [Acidimicrobiia bacterium]